MKMPFGKYRNDDIEDIPSEYLLWFAQNIKPDNKNIEMLVKACDDEWQFREKNNCHIED